MAKGERLVVGTLIILLGMCLGMVILGGYVRLSGSGLSIPEWPVFTIEKITDANGNVVREVKSVFPPATDIEWQTLYTTLVTELPQYEGVAMSEFKRMFWTEWSHRGLAKLIGLVYLVYAAMVLYFPSTRGPLGKLAIGGFLLLISQAVLGGLVVLFHLDSVKLALHLIFAFFFTSLLLWSLMLIVHPPAPPETRGRNPIYWWGMAITTLVCFQILSGGFMAGSMAGYQMNTWPRMGEVWVPAGLTNPAMSFFENFTENVIMIQFFHRWFAFAVAIAILFFVFRTMTVEVSRPARWGLRALFATVVFQIILGVTTLLLNVHTHLALTHQAVGLFLVLNCFFILYETSKHPVLLEDALAEKEEKADARSNTPGKAAYNA